MLDSSALKHETSLATLNVVKTKLIRLKIFKFGGMMRFQKKFQKNYFN